MWHRARVKTTSLQALGQLSRRSRRYQIEKIQKLSANFEKACWRTLRCAEERAYHLKYAFLKHCVNVIKARTESRKDHLVPLDNIASHIAEMFNGDNAQCLQKQINVHLEDLISSLPTCMSVDDASTVQEVVSKKAELLQQCLHHGVPLKEAQQAICKLIEIAKLKQLNKTLVSVSNSKDVAGNVTRGYMKHELESMAAAHAQLGH